MRGDWQTVCFAKTRRIAISEQTLNEQDRNILLLATAQALAGANSAVVYASGAIIGHTLSPTPGLATLPISIFVAGMALSTVPAGLIARRYGRSAAFLAGTACGVLVGLLAAAGIVSGKFWLFCLAMVFGGGHMRRLPLLCASQLQTALQWKGDRRHFHA